MPDMGEIDSFDQIYDYLILHTQMISLLLGALLNLFIKYLIPKTFHILILNPNQT